MQVQFLIDKANNNSEDFLLGWTVLPPGAMHDRHRHFHVDEFWIVVSGQGTMYTHDGGEKPRKGDGLYTKKPMAWFKNTSEEDVVLVSLSRLEYKRQHYGVFKLKRQFFPCFPKATSLGDVNVLWCRSATPTDNFSLSGAINTGVPW